MTEPKNKPKEPKQVSVPETVLQEIRSIHGSLEAISALILEATIIHPDTVVAAIDPAIERLGAIIEENNFPE
jgi:hypothetical protein